MRFRIRGKDAYDVELVFRTKFSSLYMSLSNFSYCPLMTIGVNDSIT